MDIRRCSADNAAEAIRVSGDYVYVGTLYGIEKYHLENWVCIATLSISYVMDLAVNEGYLYALTAPIDGPAQIKKIDLSTFTVVATLTFEAGETSGRSICVTPVYAGSKYLICSCATTPAKIVKVRISDFTRIGSLTLNEGETDCKEVIAPSGYVYCILEKTPTLMVYVDWVSMVREGVITLSGNLGRAACFDWDLGGHYLYVGSAYAYEGRIDKIDILYHPPTIVATLIPGYDYPYGLTIVEDGLFVCFRLTPAILMEVRLSDFTVLRTMTLLTTDSQAWDMDRTGIGKPSPVVIGCQASPYRRIRCTTGTWVSGIWAMLESNYPYYSEDLSTILVVGKSPICSNYVTNPGSSNSVNADFPDISLAKKGWRSWGKFNGSFEAGTWTFKIRLENITKYAHSVKVAIRLSKSVNGDGSNATLIGVIESPNILAVPGEAGGSVSDTWTWDAPEISMANQYLFAEYRLHVEVAGSGAGTASAFVCDEDPAVGEELIIAPAFGVPPPPPVAGYSYSNGLVSIQVAG